jgi:FAD/FMN-containing dehydrogenase
MSAGWSNWAGNVRSRPAEIVYPASEAELVTVLERARREGRTVRTVGAGHSFTPLCATEGVIVCLKRMTGVVDSDPELRTVTVRAGTTIRALGEPLWSRGLCLKNQGDIDTQHIAGAIATATHGSGSRRQCLSATARRFRVILASGEPLTVDADDADLLAAMQVSLGALGIVTEIELDVQDAVALSERIEFWELAQILDRWESEMRDRRHFSFFWMPYSNSPESLFMTTPPGMDMADRALVKLYDELPRDVLDEPAPALRLDATRVDRPYRIYPDPDFEGEIVNRELEYMVPAEQGQAAFLALRQLVLTRYRDDTFPVEVRSIAADDAWLSPFYQRPSVSISICGHEQRDYRRFLADVAATLEPFDPRPHWGKIHYMNRQQLRAALPRFDDFRTIRDRLDPDRRFLTRELADLLG